MNQTTLNKGFELSERINKAEILIQALSTLIYPIASDEPSYLTIEIYHKKMIPISETMMIPDFAKNFKGNLLHSEDLDTQTFAEFPKSKAHLRLMKVRLAKLKREFAEL